MASSGGEAADRIRAIRLSTFGAPQSVVDVGDVDRVGSVGPVEKVGVAAHREPVEKLLSEKDRLISVLMGRVSDLENRLEVVESAIRKDRMTDDGRD